MSVIAFQPSRDRLPSDWQQRIQETSDTMKFVLVLLIVAGIQLSQVHHIYGCKYIYLRYSD